MRRILTFLFIVISLASMAQNDMPVYDSVLAKSLGADEYGMKSYTLAILKTGPYNTENKTERDSLFKGHMDNIKRMADSGQLVIAGPFGKNDKQFRGLFILDTKSVEDAKIWLQNDAAINAGIFEVEYIPWYGSAAIATYLPFHERITKTKF